MDGGIAQFGSVLPTMHEALGSVPNTAETRHGGLIPRIPVLRRSIQEDHKFKSILGYTTSSVLIWQTGDAVSNKRIRVG